MPDTRVALPDGHDYAFMAIRAMHGLRPKGRFLAPLYQGQRIATDFLSLRLPARWRKELGDKVALQIEGADMYLIATAPSSANSGSTSLRQDAHFVYAGFLLSSGYLSHDGAFLIDGSVRGGDLRVTGFSEYPSVIAPRGAPLGRLSSASLGDTFRRADALSALFAADAHPRFGRILFAFLNAVTYPELDRRLHQFVRCVEGFAHPGQQGLKRRFAERTQLFIGRGVSQKALLDHLWDLRSVVEHLHGPFREISVPGERERRLVLLRRAIQAESLARHCIETFLDRRQLWPHFRDEVTIEKFWALPQRRTRLLWGDPLDLSWLQQSLDPSRIADVHLGIGG